MMSLLADINIPTYDSISGIPDDAAVVTWQEQGISGLVSSVLNYVFPIAGILVFVYLLYGGFSLMLAVGNEEGVREGKAKITNAIIGFVIIFVAYWIVQILEFILGVNLLNWNI
jgi:hypothetical protein